MLNRKVYQLLLLLDEEERTSFAAYLLSPLFGPSKTLSQFFQLWLDRVLGAEPDAVAELEVEAFLEGSGLRAARMDKYCSQLYQKLLDFFALAEFNEAKGMQLEQAALGLERRNAPAKLFEAQQQRLESHIRGLGASAEKSWQELQQQWKRAEMLTLSRETAHIWQEDFRDLHRSLDRYYQLQKLKLACASLNVHLIFNHPEAEAHREELAFLRDLPVEGMDPLSKAYWYIFQIYSDPSYPFQPLFDLLQESGQLFSKEEALEVFGYALNYCVRRATQGEFQFRKFTAAIYRELLEKEILLVDEKLPPSWVKNMVVVHCSVGELDWVEQFLISLHDRLPLGFNPFYITYNEAVVALFRGQYAQAITQFKQVISHLKNDVFYELDARTNLLIAYFEHLNHLTLEDLDELYRLQESCRFFIERNQKISQVHKAKYGNFLRFFRRLLRLMESNILDRVSMQTLYEEVEGEELLVSKNWLLEKTMLFQEPVVGVEQELRDGGSDTGG